MPTGELMDLRLEVAAAAPSPNELRRRYRHWAAYKRLREDWEQRLFLAVPGRQRRAWLRMVVEKRPRVRVEVTVFRKRPLDPDNLTGSLKPVLDGMKNLGLIVDDSKEWIELGPTKQERARGMREATVIELEEI